MRRRLRIDMDREETDRWVISYADFITLLFAFFVVMYAVSAVNESKYRVLAEALGTAFGRAPAGVEAPVPDLVPARPLAPEVRARTLAEQQALEEREHMKTVANNLLEAMGPLVKEGKVRVTQSRRGVTIEINANVLFRPGEAQLQPDSLPALEAVARTLAREPFNLEIIGHTDNVPIQSPQFPSNWELSSARASSVVRLFTQSGIAPARLYAIGREASEPVAGNDTPEGRARNRRVELLILSSLPDEAVEIPTTPTADEP